MDSSGEPGVVGVLHKPSQYNTLQEAKISVMYDDRDVRPGEKFGDADLLGIPYRAVISKKTVENSCIELKNRLDDTAQQVSYGEFIKIITS